VTRPKHAALANDRRGVTLVEFAIVAPVMLLLIMGLMDLTYRLYVQAILNGAMQQAGRSASLESGPGGLDTIDANVVKNVREVARNLTWESSHKAFSDYTKIGPEPFLDANGNGMRDPGECYSDVNNNSQWDADPGKTGAGGAKDSVVYTMTIHYPRIFPLSAMLGWGSVQDVSSTTILKNQPYTTQNATAPVTRCA
jgi:hypothetical protein